MSEAKKGQVRLFPTGHVVETSQDVEVLQDKPIYLKLTPGSKDFELLQQILSVLKYDPEKVTPQRIMRIAIRQMHQNIFQIIAKRSENNVR